MNNYIIYKHTNLINGKVYIGKTCQDIQKRFGSNGCNYRECPHFYAAIKKYGWENFSHEILYSGLSKEEANEMEQLCIERYDSRNEHKGYNIRYGGDGFDSESSKKLWRNKEYAEKIRTANSDRWKDEEYKKDISSRMVEAWKDPEKRKRRSDAAKTRWANDEFKEKVSASVKEACATPVLCIETNEMFNAIVDACNKYNIHHANLIRAIRKGCRSGGYHWAYA